MARKDYDKKTVTCYLPSNLEKQVQAYCTENELTRKAKDEDGNETIEPRWGTGIVKILEDYFNSQVQSTVQDETAQTEQAKPPASPTLEKRVDDLEEDNVDLRKKLNRLFNIINKDLPQRYVAKDATYSTTTPTTTETPDTEKTGENIDSDTDKNLETEEAKENADAPTIDVESTATYSTIASQNNETPTSEESGGIEPNQRENGEEATIPQTQGKFGHHNESLATEEAKESAIAPPETLDKQLAKDERLLDAIAEYIPAKKLKPLADCFLQLLKEYGIEEDSFKIPTRAEARYIKSFLGLSNEPRPKEGTKFRRAADVLLEAYEVAKDRKF